MTNPDTVARIEAEMSKADQMAEFYDATHKHKAEWFSGLAEGLRMALRIAKENATPDS